MGFPVIYGIHSLTELQQQQVPNDQRPLVPKRSQIVEKRYATSVDDRHFITVYEYSINSQWVMWDYFTGYVHLTGLWKAIGNNKADIVRLVDNCPELEPDLRRVRGGYLKIQGTWVPYDVGKRLASRTCWNIRYALVPIFGQDFPDTCLQPHEPGFGRLEMTLSVKRRRRRSSKLQQQQQQQQLLQQHQVQLPLQQQQQLNSLHPIAPQNHHSSLSFSSSFSLPEQSSFRDGVQFSQTMNGQAIVYRDPAPIIDNGARFAPWSLKKPTYSTNTAASNGSGRKSSFGGTSFNGLKSANSSRQNSTKTIDKHSGSHSRSAASRHRYSVSVDGAFHSYNDMYRSTGAPINTGSYTPPAFLENAIDSSPEDEGASPTPSTTPLASPTAKSPNYTTASMEPDPLPNVLSCTASSPQDLLELLQATRSLQQISAGRQGSSWSSNRSSFGGDFQCGGKLWQWDGNQNLAIVGTSPEDDAMGNEESKAKARAPSLSSGIVPRVLPWSPPVSPPRPKPAALDIKTIEPIEPMDMEVTNVSWDRTLRAATATSATSISSSSLSSTPSASTSTSITSPNSSTTGASASPRGFYMNIHSLLS